MTYDRNYNSIIELEDNMIALAISQDYRIIRKVVIAVDSIKLTNERNIKLAIQEGLSKCGLMHYGDEIGKSYLLVSNNSNSQVRCKFWCLSDHIISLEIEPHNTDVATLSHLKKDFKKAFNRSEIIWTETK